MNRRGTRPTVTLPVAALAHASALGGVYSCTGIAVAYSAALPAIFS